MQSQRNVTKSLSHIEVVPEYIYKKNNFEDHDPFIMLSLHCPLPALGGYYTSKKKNQRFDASDVRKILSAECAR